MKWYWKTLIGLGLVIIALIIIYFITILYAISNLH